MFPSVEVIRAQSNNEPRIIVQEREDTPLFAMTVQEANAWLIANVGLYCEEGGQVGGCYAPADCLWCQVNEALEGIR